MRNLHKYALGTALSLVPMSLCCIRRDDEFEGGDGKDHWPAVFYGPDGEQETFNGPLEVPDGWHDHPRKFKTGEKTRIHGYEEAVAAAERNADAEAAGGLAPEHGGTPVDPDEDDKLNGDGVDPSEPGIHNSGEGDRDVNIRETAERKGYVLPDIKDITKDEIKKQLSARKVQFNGNWNEQRLYDLLKDNLDKPADGPVVSKPVAEGNQV